MGWILSVFPEQEAKVSVLEQSSEDKLHDLHSCITTLTLDGSGSVTLFHSDGAVTVGEQAAMDYYAVFGPDLKPATHAVTAGSAGRVSITFRFVETRGGAGGSCSSDVPPPSRNSPHQCNHHLRTDVTTISAPM